MWLKCGERKRVVGEGIEEAGRGRSHVARERTFSVQKPVGMGVCLSSRQSLSDLWYGKIILLLWREGL